jgi:hypothetical protein
MTETLTGRLWSSVEHIYQGVLEHPFVTGLTDGSLPAESFRHYIVQDAHYLRGYARALAVCAAKAPTEQDTVMFAVHAAGAVAAEQDMHAELMSELGSSPAEAAAEPVAPTTRAYLSYLLATTYGGSFAEGLGAVDRDVRRRGVPDRGERRARAHRPGRRHPLTHRGGPGHRALRDHLALRVDVLGRGIAAGGLAHLSHPDVQCT